MPIQSIQQVLHLRTKKNQHVMENINRLWDISEQAKTTQEILDALHPWGKNKELHFNNTLPKLIGICGVSTLLFGWMLSPYIPFFLSFIAALICFFIAYSTYEKDDAIDQVIDHLEMQMKLLKFNIEFDQFPRVITTPSSPVVMLNRLKKHFPVFNLGTESNEIESYAATTWLSQSGIEYPVLLFKYHYISEIYMPNGDGEKQKVREIHKDLWGAFVFNTSPQGIAVTNKRNEFFRPYTQLWKTSDIAMNKKLKVFGYDSKQLAKTISPSMTLKLDNLFKESNGDLISHYQESILCYMGDKNLFWVRSRKSRKDIATVSDLRGHLRTLDMPDYEKFKQNMIEFLS